METISLPNEVKSLIERKLRQLKRKREQQWLSAEQSTYQKLQQDMLTSVQSHRLRAVFSSVPREAYKVLVAHTTTATDEWPVSVWEAITPILDTLPDLTVEQQDLDAIVDEFSWVVGQEPFTLSRVNVGRLKAAVIREASRYGISPHPRFNIDSQAARATILNAARQARASVSIAIEEYLLSRIPPSSKPDKKNKRALSKPGKDAELEVGSPEWRSQNGRNAADALHNQPGGTRDKQQQIRDIWATGKYSTRDRCAEEECAALDMSFSTARKALRNIPKPEPTT